MVGEASVTKLVDDGLLVTIKELLIKNQANRAIVLAPASYFNINQSPSQAGGRFFRPAKNF